MPPGLFINDGASKWIENWFFAVWAYNSGFNQQSNADQNSGSWGVGWFNNPANPRYPSNRTPFMDDTYEDASHPQDWPYPEKIMGWAGHPIELTETPGNLVHGYRPAWWLTEEDRWNVKPGLFDFCSDSNSCHPGAEILPDDPDVIGEPAGPCAHKNSSNGKYDLKCWYHVPVAWKACEARVCGNELLRFDPGYAYQEDATSYPPVCTLAGLPANASVVDNLPQSVPSIRPACTKPPSDGTFTFTFKPTSNGNYPGKVDVHQLGWGYGGHFWMSNTQRDAGRQAVGIWRLNRTHNGPMRLLVHLPDPGARTNEAHYRVNSTRGGRVETVNQAGAPGARWVDIGTYMFDGVTPTVSLSNLTAGGDGTKRIAWDAVAFIPVNGQFHENTVEAVAVFDEDQNIDTAAPGSWLGGPLGDRESLYQWAHGTVTDLVDTVALRPGDSSSSQLLETADRNSRCRSGPDHPDGASIATWIGFAQPYTDRPTSDQRPGWFDDEDRFKIKSSASVQFITGDNGKIIQGSESVAYKHRTGNTHLPKIVMDLFAALDADYSIGRPDLSYSMPDLNVHDGVWRSADPSRDGVLPGRAYSYAGTAPALSGSGDCVRVLMSSGGSIGYRPMLSQSGPTGAMEAWSSRVADHPQVPPAVKELAKDVRDLFFNPGVVSGIDASLFNDAPPIWQELYFHACADGKVRRVDEHSPILRSSWMPDQYLYHNGKAVNRDGLNTGTSRPVMRGDFFRFSMIPEFASGTAYGLCGPISEYEREGNPWAISPHIPSQPGINPEFVGFCSNRTINPDPQYSS